MTRTPNRPPSEDDARDAPLEIDSADFEEIEHEDSVEEPAQTPLPPAATSLAALPPPEDTLAEPAPLPPAATSLAAESLPSEVIRTSLSVAGNSVQAPLLTPIAGAPDPANQGPVSLPPPSVATEAVPVVHKPDAHGSPRLMDILASLEDRPQEAPPAESADANAAFEEMVALQPAKPALEFFAGPPKEPGGPPEDHEALPPVTAFQRMTRRFTKLPEPGAKTKRVSVRVGVALGAMAILAALAWLMWPRSEPRVAPTAAPVPVPPHVVIAVKPVLWPVKLNPFTPPEPLAHTRAALPPVTASNIDNVGYEALAAGAKALAADRDSVDLFHWAQWRLAHGFNDADAAKELIAHVKVNKRTPTLGLAAAAGAALLQNKPATARRLLAPAMRRAATRTAPVLYLQALILARQAIAVPKVLLWLDRTLKANPDFYDAQLLRAQLLQNEHSREAGRAFVALSQSGDPDLIAQSAMALIHDAEFNHLPEITAHLTTNVDPAPERRSQVLQLMMARALHDADIRLAHAQAITQLHEEPNNAAALIASSRFVGYAHADAAATLRAGLTNMTDFEARSAASFEAVRDAYMRHDAAAAHAGAEAVGALPAPGYHAPLADALAAALDGNSALAQTLLAPVIHGEGSAPEALGWAMVLRQAERPVPVKWDNPGPAPSVVLWHNAHAFSRGLRFGEAARAAQELFWRDPTFVDPVDWMLHTANWLDQSGSSARAHVIVDTLAAKLPEDDRPTRQKIGLAQRAKAWDTAEAGYKLLLKHHVNDRALTLGLANLYIEAGRVDAAVASLEALTAADPQARDAEYLYTLARAVGLHDAPRAHSYLQESIKVKPTVDAYLLLSELEAGRGQPNEAVLALRQALPLAPENISVHMRLARLLLTQHHPSEAVVVLQNLIDHVPDQAEAAKLLGDSLRDAGDNLGALAAFQKADRAHPGQPDLLLKIAVLQLEELRDVDAAILTLRRLLVVAPRAPEGYYHLGYALRDQGKTAAARRVLKTYLRLAPKGPYARDIKRDLAAM